MEFPAEPGTPGAPQPEGTRLRAMAHTGSPSCRLPGIWTPSPAAACSSLVPVAAGLGAVSGTLPLTEGLRLRRLVRTRSRPGELHRRAEDFQGTGSGLLDLASLHSRSVADDVSELPRARHRDLLDQPAACRP